MLDWSDIPLRAFYDDTPHMNSTSSSKQSLIKTTEIDSMDSNINPECSSNSSHSALSTQSYTFPRNSRALRLNLTEPDEKVRFNIGGQKFVTRKSTLQNVPNTLLANLTSTDRSYDTNRNEYFFDRNPKYFASILDFYRTGKLHFSHNLCGPSIKAELDFWGIDDNCISECCWKSYKDYYEQKATLDELNQLFQDSGKKEKGRTAPRNEDESWFCKIKNFLWQFLDKPDSSKGAQIWAIIFFILILVSIVIVVLETHPSFRTRRKDFDLDDFTKTNQTINPKLLMYYKTIPHMSLQVIDGICVVIFTVELITRMIVCPSKLRFIKSVFNIIDVLCVLPLFAVFIIQTITDGFLLKEQSIILIGYLSLTSVLRIFRLFKIARHYRSFRLLILAVKSSVKELLLLILLISMGMLIFSTLIYFAEFKEQKFRHIPIGLWWSIITMTTVGYGDIRPNSGWGFLVGGFCAVSGMLITGLPIPIIASNFNHYHTNARFAASLTSKKNATSTKWRNDNNNNKKSPKSTVQSVASSPRVFCGPPAGFTMNYNDPMYQINVPVERNPRSPAYARRARSAITAEEIQAIVSSDLMTVQKNGELVKRELHCPRIVTIPPDDEDREQSNIDDNTDENTLHKPMINLSPVSTS